MIDITPTRASRFPVALVSRRHATSFALAAMLALPLAAIAQHPGDFSGRPDPAETRCASVEGSRQVECEVREAEREADKARISREYHGWLADRLVEDGGARNLAIAAHLRAMSVSGMLYESDDTLPALKNDDRIAEWVERATREGQDDPLVHALLNRRFSTSDDQRLSALRMRWSRIAPDNFAPVMFSTEAGRSGTNDMTALAHNASRFDLHYNALLHAVVDAFERHPPSAERAAVLFGGDVPTLHSYASSMAMAMLQLPRFIDTIDACRGDALIRTPERRADCLQVGRLLADDSDTLIAHMMGLAILVRASDTPCARKAAEERRRHAAWLMNRWQVLLNDPTVQTDDEASRQALSSTQDEMAFMRTILEHHGIAIEPAADWTHVPLQ